MTATRHVTISFPARSKTLRLADTTPARVPEWLTPDEVCERLKVSRATLNAWVRAGRIAPAFRDGRVVRYRDDQLDALGGASA